MFPRLGRWGHIIEERMAIAANLKGRYEVREVLAQGGMGVVYIGYDTIMKRPVAIKTLLDMTDENAVRLFQKECEDLASLSHPNIIEIYDVGHYEEDHVLRPYLVMPLLQGVTLDKLIRSSSPRLTVERSVDMICQACRGLHAAHERGLIHRDIKPSNLFVMDDDSVKIIDFGVAHRTETERTLGRRGTLLYMSPEQLAMKPLSPASDIFSLAVVCYETLTRRRPFERAGDNSVADAILHFTPPPVSDLNPAVNRVISQAIHKGMAKQARHRFANGKEFGDTLQRALRNEPIDIFNPARIRPRVERAAQTFERGDFQFASEIIGELEAEGHLDPSISELRRTIDGALKRQSIAQLLERARSRMEEGEPQLALQKVNEILQIDPSQGDALVLKARIDKERARAIQLQADRDQQESEYVRMSQENEQRQAVSPAVAETVRNVESETDLGRRVALLEAALKTNPGEPQLERLLQRTQEKRQLVESIVAKARIHELQGQVADALAQWEMLRTIQPQYAGLSAEIERLSRQRGEPAQPAPRNQWVEQVEGLLAGQDFLRAIDVIGEARKELPGNKELDLLETRAWRGLGGAPSVGQQTSTVKRDTADARREDSLETLQQEYARDNRNPVVRSALLSALLERATAIVDATPGDAEQLLQQAVQIDPANAQARAMLNLIEQRRHERLVEGCLYQARWLESQGDVTGAVRALDAGLKKYPSESRLVELRDSLAAKLEPAAPKAPEPVISRAAEPVKAEPVKTEPVKAPEPVKPVGLETSAQPASAKLPWEEEVQPAVTPAAAAPPPVPTPVAPPQQPRKPALPAALLRPKIWAGVGAAVVALVLIVGVAKLIPRKQPAAPPVAATAVRQAVLEVTTSPAGALILVDGKESGTASAPLGLTLNAGTVQVEARLPGYQSARASADLQPGVRSPITLTLTPILSLRFLLPGDGDVTVNDEQPVKVEGGTFSRDVTPGTYTVKIKSGQTGQLSFGFQVAPDGGLVALSSPPTAKDVSALLISNYGDQGKIYTTGSPVKVKLDGQALGQLTKGGLDLPKAGAGSHDLELGEGQDLRKKSADFGAARTLTAIIDSDPNTGTLVVKANEDGAAVSVLSGGKEVARGQIKKGSFRVPNLRALTYVVKATKDGFNVDSSEQSAAIQKGQDKTIAFNFQKKPQTGIAHLRLTPGSELLADGTAVSGVTGDSYTIRDLKPGSHTFRAQKGKQFLPNSKSIDVVAGETSEVDLRLASAPIPIEIKRNPAESTVTYTRAGDPTAHTFVGNRQELPEGDYTFEARAKGYLERVQEIHIAWDFVGPLDLAESVVKPAAPKSLTMTDWGNNAWTETPGWYMRKGGGIIVFPKPLGTGTVEFTIHWQGKGRAQWIVNETEGNYLQYELTDDGFQVFRAAGGKKPSALGKKKPVSKMPSYTIRIEVKPDGVTHKLQKDGAWETLDTTPETASPTGKFGFNIPNGQELFLANFTFQPER